MNELLLATWSSSRAGVYVVDGQHPQASDENPGTGERPFKTIGKAAALVQPGDNAIVKAGIYRESVNLTRSGAHQAPIAFATDPPGKVVITGTDVIRGREREEGYAPIYRWNGPISSSSTAGLTAHRRARCVRLAADET